MDEPVSPSWGAPGAGSDASRSTPAAAGAIRSKPLRRTRYTLDITSLGRATTVWPLELRWAREVGGVLYVANAHRTYASSTRNRNGYLTALDPNTGRVLWQSPSLVANADSFAVVGDLIVTGYGFTAEADYLYALDRETGRVLTRLSLRKGQRGSLRTAPG